MTERASIKTMRRWGLSWWRIIRCCLGRHGHSHYERRGQYAPYERRCSVCGEYTG